MSDTIVIPDSDVDVTLDRAWAVVILDDPVNLISYVKSVLMIDLSMDELRATQVTMEVHTLGRSVAFSGERDEAMVIKSKLQARGLTVQVEQQ